MPRIQRLLVATACAALAPAAAFAADRKVPSADYPTIQSAASAAENGDRILVGKGTWYENVVVTANDVQIVGKKAVWDGHIAGAPGVCLTVRGAGCTVSGFTFRNGTTHVRFEAGGGSLLKCTSRGAGRDAFEFQSSPDSTVQKCTVIGSRGDGIAATGSASFSAYRNTIRGSAERGIAFQTCDDVVLERNVISNGGDAAIEGDGARAAVRSNRITNMGGEGVNVGSDGCSIQLNSVSGTGDTGIGCSGQNCKVERNSVVAVNNGSAGISFSGGGDDTSIDDNEVGDVLGIGIYVGANGVSVDDNTVYRCGVFDGASIYCQGNDNVLERNTVVDADGVGAIVDGTSNTIFFLEVDRSAKDGVVVMGVDNNLYHLRVTGCDGEGIENRGTGTRLEDSYFATNRLDVARTVTSTWAPAPFIGVTYRTGGPEQFAQVE